MNTDELYEDIDNTQSVTQKYLGLSLSKFFALFLVVSVVGVYLGVLFYGTNSVEILFGLEEYQDYLHTEISRLKNENSELQRTYFELKEISAQ